jgi:hypothetical protein
MAAQRNRGRGNIPAESTDEVAARRQKLIELLKERRGLAWAAQNAYYERSSILTAMNYLIGIPVVLITALAGSEIVASRASDEPIPIWFGLISLSAAVLASLQTFLRFGERAAFSAKAGHDYALIRRQIEDALTKAPRDMEREFNVIRQRMDKAGEQSPPIGERRWLTWSTYAEAGHVPRRRPWWRALLGIPNRGLRRLTANGQKVSPPAR